MFLYLAFALYVIFFTIDDAYISMRYARNLADGHGLVFNIGDLPIEGYTNFLLVAIEAALMRVGVASVWVPKGVNLVAGALFVYALAASRRDLWGVAAAMMVATATPFVLWTAGGLETVLFAALAGGGVLAAIHNRYGLAQSLLVLAALTRPEGMLFWLAGSMYTWRNDRRAVLAGATILAVYHLWRVSYFGALLPATFSAKETPLNSDTVIGGLGRLFGFLGFNASGLVLFASVAALCLKRNRAARLVGALIGVYTLYLVTRGYATAMDDGYRLYVPLVALSGVGLALAGDSIRRHLSPVALAVALAALLFLRASDLRLVWAVDINAGAFDRHMSALSIAVGLERGHTAAGEWLHQNAEPDDLIVLHDAGAIPYYSGLRTLDTWSLTDRQAIAYRRAGDVDGLRAYALAQEPEWIVQDRIGLIAATDDYVLRATFEYLPNYLIRIYQRRDPMPTA